MCSDRYLSNKRYIAYEEVKHARFLGTGFIQMTD